MKRIAITQRLVAHPDYDECRETLDISWAKLFEKIDLLPIVLPYEIDFQKYFKELKIDGILLSGGNDLYSLNQNELSKKRDTFEKKLISYAIKNKIPVFGVCRGMQVIAEYFGSTFKSVDSQVNITHKLLAKKESKYFTHLKEIQTVNSFHNYAIDKLSGELLVCASSDANIIKAIEHKEYKIFAQMWHSERVKQFNPHELELIKDFFND